MPHSSGGGSHGGGFHGGSHGGSHGSSGPSYRTSRTYFAGSLMYVYYDRNYTSHKIYSNKNKIERNKPGKYLLFILIISVLIGALLFVNYRNPKKLSTSYNTNIVIEDTMDVLSSYEEEELNEAFERFLNKTGITPAFYSISNSSYSGSLETVAYNKYVSRFNDEKHWLIVYSADSNTFKSNYHFEGMQGDDTDEILTYSIAKSFNKKVYNYLESSYYPGAAFVMAFNNLSNTIMDKGFVINWSTTLILALFIVLMIVCLSRMIYDDIIASKLRNANGVSPSAALLQCPHCGLEYFQGSMIRCVKCGAILPTPFNEYKQD